MKTQPIVGALLLVLLTSTASATVFHVEKQADTWIQQGAEGLSGFIQTDVRVDNGTSASAGNPGQGDQPPSSGLVEVYVPLAATGVEADYLEEGVRQPVPNARVTKLTSPDPAFDLYRVNVTASVKALSPGKRFGVLVSFQVPTPTVQARVRYAGDTLLVFAHPGPGFEPASQRLQAFAPATGSSFHSVNTAPGAAFAYDLVFVQAPVAAGTSDSSKYVWGGAGIAVGLVFAYAAVRQGWLGGARAKKFVKGGEMESRSMLEARRRTLMAALKELEAAHDAKEVPDDVHGALKEEYKAQTVRVLRTIEEKKEGS